MKFFLRKNFLTLTMLMILCSTALLAQRQIVGKVTDKETGEGLIGASIFAVGSSAGAATDVEGRFRLSVPEGVTQIRINYTGYAEQTITLGASNVYDVQMAPGTELEEVLVIGYGTVKKEDATGAVNAIDEKSFNKGAIVSPQQLMAGKIAGVSIVQNSGEPGGGVTVRIRGGTSVSAANEPLYVIDGVPIDNRNFNPGGFSDGRNPLNFLNPNDIESVTVLKDASSTAIYGSRAANGVVMITTKKGKKGSSTVSYDGYYNVSQFTSQPNILNAEQFKNVVTFVAPNRIEKLGKANTNWFDEITQNASGQFHSLSFNTGADNMGLRVSLGYQQLEGVIRTSETERTSLNISYNQSFFDNVLKVSSSIKSSYTKDNFNPGVIGAAWSFDPTQAVLDPSNRAFGGFFEYSQALTPRNPVSGIQQINDIGKTFRNLGNIQFELDMGKSVKGLSATVNVGADLTNAVRRRNTPTTYQRAPLSSENGEIRNENLTSINPLLDLYMTYKKAIGNNHRFDVTGGYSYQDFYYEYPSWRAFNLAGDNFGPNSTRLASDFESNNFVIENRLISFFGRANYSFKDRYLLTASLRRDGSTRFGPENKWGYFPSAAIAWRVMQEEWASSLSNIFYDLKVRLSYGVNGNQEIGDFRYLPTYSFSDVRARYQFGGGFINTARPNGYDAGLKWEETTSWNAGLDFGFWGGRLTGTVDYYVKRTDDLLFTVNVPAGTNLTDRVLTNIGELENKGLELTLELAAISKPKFSWNIGFNAAFNKNEVLAIDRISDKGILTGGISGGVGNNVQILQVGQPINSFFVFKHKTSTDGKPLADNKDHNEDGTINLLDIYEDLNGDKKVDDSDKRPFEKPAADIILGITTSLNWHNLDFGFTLRGSVNNYVYNNNASNGGYFNRVNERGDLFLNNLHTSALVTNYQAPQYFSDYYIEDASFLRMDNVTLGYTFNQLKGGRSIRAYVTSQNPFVWTRYSGLDPEVGNGIDNNPYPRSRSFQVGISLGL